MERLKSWFNIYRKRVLIIFSICICIVGVLSFTMINNTFEAKEIDHEDSFTLIDSVTDNIDSNLNKIDEDKIMEKKINVDVKGAVKTPGVYQLDEGSRVIDAIEIAGGLTKSAYTRNLNLSKKLKDENVILINTKAEIDELLKKDDKILIKEVIKEIPCEKISDACIQEEIITNATEQEMDNNEGTLTNNEESNKFVNINTADINDLMTLNGIGESKAKSIIEYRETNGLFKSIEDIKNISGIGEKMYEKIKDYITTE